MKRQINCILAGVLFVLASIFPLNALAEGGTMPEERLKPRLVDMAGLLSDEEESGLLEKLDEISERQGVDVVIVTADSLEGESAMAYADDFYDYNGYGFGGGRDGILLLVSMEYRDWWISTCGYGITAFTDSGQSYISDKFLPLLSDGDYIGAFTKFAGLCDRFITQARKGRPYDTGHFPKEKLHPVWIIYDLLIGFGIALVLGLMKKSKMKSVVKQRSAEEYTKAGSVKVTRSRDRLLNKTVSRRTIPKNTGSGSSTHTSSSGRSHGGSGGKF